MFLALYHGCSKKAAAHHAGHPPREGDLWFGVSVCVCMCVCVCVCAFMCVRALDCAQFSRVYTQTQRDREGERHTQTLQNDRQFGQSATAYAPYMCSLYVPLMCARRAPYAPYMCHIAPCGTPDNPQQQARTCDVESSHRLAPRVSWPRQTFWKVSASVHFRCHVTMESTFENLCCVERVVVRICAIHRESVLLRIYVCILYIYIYIYI